MEFDSPASDPLPTHLEPESRVSCTLAQNDLLRRVIAWLIYRYHLPHNIGLGKFELDHAPVRTLMVVQDKQGNATITIDPKDMGS